MSRVVYSPKYNIGFYGFERLHPFDSRKYGRAWKQLRAHLGTALRKFHVSPDRAVSREELLLVHTEAYLEQLSDSQYVAQALELAPLQFLPFWVIDHHILRPMRWATRGTIVAAQEAIKHGLAINLSGGYHHAKPGQGEGFCIYADAAIAVSALREQELISQTDRIIHIDTDAHQGIKGV